MEKKKEKFAIYFIIFTIVAAIVTATAIYITITEHNKNIQEEQAKIQANKIQAEINRKKQEENDRIQAEKITEKTKNIAEDSKYKINSYDETYNTNALKYTYYEDIDGREFKKSGQMEYIGVTSKKYRLEYVQIEGLKDKNIQEQINTKIKQEAYSLLKENVSSVDIYINSSFSNVLSLRITSFNEEQGSKTKCINIDLTTGEEIPFEKIFVSSAPLNSLLAEGLYKALAWNVNLDEGEFSQYEKNHDMDQRDTSEYEDKFLLFIENYNQEKEKGNIQFAIFPNQVTLYDIVSPEIAKGIYGNKLSISIDFINHMEDIAIYKRYLKNESIFENDELADKNIVIFTQNPHVDGYTDILKYGMISDQIFVEEVISKNGKFEEEIYSKMLEYIKEKSKENLNKVKSEISSDNAMFYQVEYQINERSEEERYQVNVTISKAICSLEYFKTNGFKEFIELDNKPSASPELKMFGYYQDFTNFDASIDYDEYSFDLDGNIIQ